MFRRPPAIPPRYSHLIRGRAMPRKILAHAALGTLFFRAAPET
jgi:hypothetical protein